MKYFKLIGIMSLLVFSFYLTDLATEFAINSNPLMQTIKDNSKNYNTISVNATINDNTIIPGIKGKVVNEMESFLNMKDFGSFNSNYLLYDFIEPEVSLNDNKEKIIISGNKKLRQVTLLVRDTNLVEYLKNNKYKYTKLIKYDDLLDKDNVNIESDRLKFLDVDTLLNKKELNNKICILDYSNIENCKKKKYYIVKPNIVIKNNNMVSNISNIDNGSIIYLSDNLSLDNLKIIINLIKRKDMKLVYLSEIIKE